MSITTETRTIQQKMNKMSSSNGTTSNTTKNIVPPHIPSGFQKRKVEIGLGIVLLTTVYASCYFGYQQSTSIWGLPPPAKEYCVDTPDDTICSRSDLFAFQISSGIAIFTCGVIGFIAWCITKTPHTKLPSTPQGRLFGYLQESETIATYNFTFQVWDFFISLLIPEHCGLLMLLHHAMAALICYCSLEYQVLHYYGGKLCKIAFFIAYIDTCLCYIFFCPTTHTNAFIICTTVFFLGLTETSSTFLVFLDLAKFFPPTKDTFFDVLIGIAGPCFLISFALVRVILWWKVSYLLWKDCYHVVIKGIAEQLRPGKSKVLYVFLGLNIPLSLLQLYWFTIIIEEAMKVLGVIES